MREVDTTTMDAAPFSDLDTALARSRQIDAPVFLYWGTKWCPPCAELHATVLKRSSFRARLAHMVALDVDGDALGAQACGERLDTEVYPTLLVLGGDEREWIRMPCGLSEDAFCAVIDAALRRRTPMAELAHALKDAASRLHEDDLTLLAFHYWPQDRRIHGGSARLALLDRLDEVLPAGSESAARTLTWQLVERAARPAAETVPAVRHRLFDRFQALLHSRHATYSTLYYLLVGLESVLDLLCENDIAGRRRELSQSTGRVLLRLVDDTTLSWTERLIAQSASVSLHSTPELPGGPAELVGRTQALVASADAATSSATERQSVMNMAAHLLRQSGLREESLRLFRAEIGRSPWPTYFMPYVAEMYMEENDRDEALRWWRRSYEETAGKTTRFELGARYIAALARHAPQERALIESTLARLFVERGDDVDMARGRVRKSLGLLARTFASLGT
ncbi:MAG: thioredoxin family protein [Steroidobacteraceae bacterium]|jgi:hypothetical protein